MQLAEPAAIYANLCALPSSADVILAMVLLTLPI